jgi:hypothetical protein
MTNEENNDDFKATANATGDGSSTVTPSPLASMRQYCLTCCNGSAHEVSLCPATSCSLWVYRFGRKPTAAMLAGADDCLMYPVEDGTTIAEFFEGGGTVLRAIRRHCIDCSGDSKSAVRDCRETSCDMHRFRNGTNPNRTLGPKQREIAAARLKANVERAKAAKVAGGQNSPTHVGKKP